MLLVISGILIISWLLWAGWKFFSTIDWEEPADPSPDLRGMHKRQAELMHIQAVLAQAAQKGKISQIALEEFDRYSEAEIAEMQQIESAWKNRHKVDKVLSQ
jgi:hypothetical protein